jgi:hypothetical protein
MKDQQVFHANGFLYQLLLRENPQLLQQHWHRMQLMMVQNKWVRGDQL